MQLRFPTAIVLAALAAVPLPASAQQTGYTLQQVEQKYPRMKTVHIQKCDHNGDNVYTKTEMICVQSIYQSMYVDR